MRSKKTQSINRRTFLQSAATSAAGLTVLAASSARSYAANSKLELGIIGAGSRGIWIGNLFQENTDTHVAAVHDYFQDRVDEAKERLGAERGYTGLEGYRELIASGVDAVAVESPPYFHPDHAVAALEAGKHVYLAKPIAVDAPGCLRIVEASKKAGAGVSCLVDFQTRNNEFFREAARLIHEGKIGTPVCGQAYYHTGRLGIKTAPGTECARLRNWVFDIALSGDIIVEQNIHVLDVANWFFNGHPVKAHGCGGRKARVDVGDCWDHFIVTYEYADGALLDFSSNQFAPGFDDLCTRVYGVEGVCDAHYGGKVSINAKSGPWAGGETSRIYREGAVNNMKDFHAGIMSGTPVITIESGAQSTLTSILGRMAAYRRETITWDAMLAEMETLDPKLELPEDGPYTKPA